jgi:transposase-like protein
MTRSLRRQHGGNVKARAVVEAIRGQRTINEIASELEVHPVQITKWKKQLLENLPEFFSRRKEASVRAEETLKARLYEEIGQLKVELDWLKKKSGLGAF